MSGTMKIIYRAMETEDYDQVYRLWQSIKGFGIRSLDDSREGVERFLKRNPATSVVAIQNGRIVGNILCGNDGINGYLYQVCVEKSYRKHGIGHEMAKWCMYALKEEGINKISLIAFKSNQVGNAFWQGVGWKERADVNFYDFVLNEENITKFIG